MSMLQPVEYQLVIAKQRMEVLTRPSRCPFRRKRRVRRRVANGLRRLTDWVEPALAIRVCPAASRERPSPPTGERPCDPRSFVSHGRSRAFDAGRRSGDSNIAGGLSGAGGVERGGDGLEVRDELVEFVRLEAVVRRRVEVVGE